MELHAVMLFLFKSVSAFILFAVCAGTLLWCFYRLSHRLVEMIQRRHHDCSNCARRQECHLELYYQGIPVPNSCDDFVLLKKSKREDI